MILWKIQMSVTNILQHFVCNVLQFTYFNEKLNLNKFKL